MRAIAHDTRAGRDCGYEPPVVTDHGSLAEITADQLVLADVARASLGLLAATACSPIVPGGGGGGGGNPVAPDTGGVLDNSGSGGQGAVDPTATTPDTGTTLGDATPVGGDPSAGGGTGGGTGGGADPAAVSDAGAGGRLPFTGYAVMGVAALGVSAMSAGAAIRAFVQRRDPPQDI